MQIKHLVFIFLLLFITAGCRNDKLPAEYLSDVAVVRVVKEAPQTNISKPDDTDKTEKAQPKKEHDTRFHIIVASYTENNRSNAEKLVQELQALGYQSSLISSNKRLRVSLESYTDENQAISKRDFYRKELDRHDLWLLTYPCD
ncbi:MAG: SPOR domain-containing protein [Culturomica sp.]|jgi:hypothetical protein|nr:SPOR domain-containing protein [Culturomica sp.]